MPNGFKVPRASVAPNSCSPITWSQSLRWAGCRMQMSFLLEPTRAQPSSYFTIRSRAIERVTRAAPQPLATGNCGRGCRADQWVDVADARRAAGLVAAATDERTVGALPRCGQGLVARSRRFCIKRCGTSPACATSSGATQRDHQPAARVAHSASDTRKTLRIQTQRRNHQPAAVNFARVASSAGLGTSPPRELRYRSKRPPSIIGRYAPLP